MPKTERSPSKPVGAPLDRRGFLRGAAKAGLLASLAGSSLSSPFVARAGAPTAAPQAASLAGYQRLFPDLAPAAFDPADLKRLAEGDGEELSGMTAEPETLKDVAGKPRRDAQGRLMITATEEDKQDEEENFSTPAGYTYLGQFIDHDLTFNPIEAFTGAPPVEAHANLRSARFDLDSLYGRGPGDQPYLYENDGRRLLRGRRLTQGGVSAGAFDHPRLNAKALLGDKRNDENVLVSQLHGVFAAFHNRVALENPSFEFEALRQIVTWHYQWIVLTDFLPRLCGMNRMEAVLPGFGAGGRVADVAPQRKITGGLPAGAMPLEFASAAYRFGHSMIRPIYRLHQQMTGTREQIRDNPAVAGRKLIFAAAQLEGLNGFREFPADWGVDWRLFFEIDRKLDYMAVNEGKRRVQAAYKLDTSLVNPLAFLPEFSELMKTGDFARDANGQPRPAGGAISSLAMRNLLRGVQHGLPSGQAAARAMGLDPIADADLKVGKASVADMTENRPITAYGDSFAGNAPLWFYVLAEAQHDWTRRAQGFDGSEEARNALPSFLGPVGGQIVAESMVAMMATDPTSLLHAHRDWRPNYLRNGIFDMAALVEAAGQAGI